MIYHGAMDALHSRIAFCQQLLSHALPSLALSIVVAFLVNRI